MIDITGVDLIEFAKAVYDLSVPQGLGFLHATSEPLSDEEAKSLISKSTNALDMDYVKGRACKMHVWEKDGRLTISDSWYDHTDRIYEELLAKFNIHREKAIEHGCACNCMDCQYEQSQKQSVL